VHNRIEGEVRYNSYGIGYKPVNGHYEICHNPLKDATIDEMMAYPLPEACCIDRKQIRIWGEQAKYLHENTDYAVMASHPVLGVFEIGCWLFGFDDYLYRLAAEPERVHAFSERILDYQKEVIHIYYSELGPWIDCTSSGDDFGMQTGTFMGTEGYILSPAHCIQQDVPAENVAAIYQGARDFYGV
jgi:uroporphyrinogen decarboxylase